MYLDIKDATESLKSTQSKLAKQFDSRVQHLNIPTCKHVRIDISGMLLFIHNSLRSANKSIVDKALDKLGSGELSVSSPEAQGMANHQH